MPIGVEKTPKTANIEKIIVDSIKYKKKIIITQYYKVPTSEDNYSIERQKEIDKCLLFNLENILIEEVHLLTETPYEFEFVPENLQSKIKQTVIGKRLDYNTAFEYYNLNLAGTICILCNADIFTDDSISILDSINLTDTILALTRYEWDDDNKAALLCGMEHKSKANNIYPDYSPTVWGQDAWIWNMEKIVVKNADFNLGTYSCDARIAHFILDSGYKIYNPSYLISINHYDRLGRTYVNNDVFKGKISSGRDPVQDHLLYKSFLTNKDECVDKYTYSQVYTKKIFNVNKDGNIYPHYLNDIDIKKSLSNIESTVKDNFGNIVRFESGLLLEHAKQEGYNKISYLEAEFNDIYGVYIIDIKCKHLSKDDMDISIVRKFKLYYENEDEKWVEYDKTFPGLSRANGNFIKRNYLQKPIFCKKIRISILEFSGTPELRVRFFGNTIEEKNIKNHKMIYFNNSWQGPAITEYNIYRNLKASVDLPYNYFAFPWATMIDDIDKNKSNIHVLIDAYYNNYNSDYFTVVQHIKYKVLFSIFNKLCIKYVFTSHYTEADNQTALEYGIKLYPFPLYAVVKKDTRKGTIREKTYLASFIGNYTKIYLSNIRKKILEEFSNYSDCYVKKRDYWHYEKMVYNNDETCNKLYTEEYKDILEKSIFSLCPSGAGPNSIRLWESLSFGSIPVILADEFVLPEIKGVDWDKIVIRWKEERIGELYDYLKSLSKEQINTMALGAQSIFRDYFDDDSQINIIYDTINKNPNINLVNKRYSLVILNWKRPVNVIKIVNNMCSFNYIDEILVSNGNNEYFVNIDRDKVKIFNDSKINSNYGLDRRFLTALKARNDDIIMIDDDVYIENEEMSKIIKEYENNNNRIVGIFGRDCTNNLYKYGDVFGEVDILLTKTMVFKKKLATLFFLLKPLIEDIYKEGKPYGNGEDILLSFIGSIYYNTKHYSIQNIKTTELDQAEVAISAGKTHLEYRIKFTQYLYRNKDNFDRVIKGLNL